MKFFEKIELVYIYVYTSVHTYAHTSECLNICLFLCISMYKTHILSIYRVVTSNFKFETFSLFHMPHNHLQETMDLFLVSMDLSSVNISYVWNHTLCGILYLVALIYINIFEVYLCYAM